MYAIGYVIDLVIHVFKFFICQVNKVLLMDKNCSIIIEPLN